MILQSLVSLYDSLASQGKIAQPGWNTERVSFALCIDGEGNFQQLIDLREIPSGKSKAEPRKMIVPAGEKRTVGIVPHFLCDNAGYILGLYDDAIEDNKKQIKEINDVGKKYAECQQLHNQLLKGAASETAVAIVRFFEKWVPETDCQREEIQRSKKELLAGYNIVFRVNQQFAQDDAELKNIWIDNYEQEKGDKCQCCVTGREDYISNVHPSIKNVKDAQSSGAALISYNADAFCSFGKEQNQNSSVGKTAAFKYTSALNFLLSDKESVQIIGDASVVCWAENAAPQYKRFTLAALQGKSDEFSETDLRAAVKRLAEGKPLEKLDISPKTEFYILGISPNAARLSVRFFYHSEFGKLMKNVNDHYDRFEIYKAGNDPYKTIPLWALLRETVNKNTKDKSSPILAGAVSQAIFTGSSYPVSLLFGTMMRIRSEREITKEKAAIIKAYYLKNENAQCPKEVLTVSLNENSQNVPYVLGRLFAVYEKAQEAANPGINATIKDRYFNAASSTPATIFPILANLSQKHLRKMNEGSRIWYEKQITELKGFLGEQYPTRLSLPEQGAFDLGYYHQVQKFYTKKED